MWERGALNGVHHFNSPEAPAVAGNDGEEKKESVTAMRREEGRGGEGRGGEGRPLLDMVLLV
jgi:hypothetical protein